jgi:hypothetical protein
VDSAGYVYVVGTTSSAESTFPVTAGAFDATYNGQGSNNYGDAFVAKVKPDGTGLVYATYIGGSQDDRGLGLALDSDGSVFLTGDTSSTEAQGFPVLVGPDLTHNGGLDGFVAKLNASGTALVYSGFIGGSGLDRGWRIARDSSGQAYVAGMTSSSEASFPVTALAYDTTHNGGQDGFVAKVAADGASLVYCTYLGSPGTDAMGGIAVDSSGRAHVTGNTDNATFPAFHGPAHAGSADVFVTRFSATGGWLEFSRFLGGSDIDFGQGIALDASGSFYVTGQTRSSNFPRTSLQTFQGGYDAFVAKLDSSGTLVYSGLIGGSGSDQGFAIAVDASGNAYVAGQTDSTPAQFFPVTDGPDLTHNGAEDAFVAKVNAAGSALVYCGYIGGSGSDYANGIAVDGAGQAYLTGYAASTQAQGFPVTVGPDLTHNATADAFVVKLASAALALGDHPASGGQVGDQFATTSPVSDAVLFRFRLTRSATVTVDTLRVRFTTTSGVANGDVTGGALWVDVNDDGVGDTLVQGSVTPSGGVLTFTTDFTPSDTGTSYLVRASVANLVAGDTTTFSVAPADIDTVQAGVAKAGAITDATHVQDYASGGDVYYSVGTSTADLKTGNPWITVSNGVAVLTVAQVGNMGVGDVITYNFSNSKAYIRAILSPTRFVVQTVTGALPPNHAGSNVNSIARVFNTVGAAVTGSRGASFLVNGDLVSQDRRLTWVLYNDGPFLETVTISNYTTDATRFTTLTVAGASQVASGISQRHAGTAGSGAVVRPPTGSGIVASADYAVIEWVDVDGVTTSTNSHGIRANNTNVSVRSCLVHDFTYNTSSGIWGAGGNLEIRNSIVYNVQGGGHNYCVNFNQSNDNRIYNSTLHGCDDGLTAYQSTGNVVENVISVGHSALDFDEESGGVLATFNHNLSEDSTATTLGALRGGTGNLANRPAAGVLRSPSAPYDLHLKPGSDAIDAGKDLGASFSDDVDGQARPYGVAWDIGADEVGSFAATKLRVLSGSYAGDGNDNRVVHVGFQPDVVIVDSQGTTGGTEAVIRTSTMLGDASKELDAGTPTALAANKIQSFTSTGFVVGSDPDVNETGAGRTYHWVAMQAGTGVMKVGTYTGNGTTRTITGLGFSPVYVVVIPAAAQDPVQRSATMPAGFSRNFVAFAIGDGITSLHGDGFTVGANARVNANGAAYHYVAWASVPGSVAVGSYTGNGGDPRNIGGAGFLPAWVLLSRNYGNGTLGDQGSAPVHKPGSTGISTDAALLLNSNLAEADNIQALQADGFQVGSHVRVNSSTAPNAYHWVAFGPHTPTTHYRSIGSTSPYGAGASGATVTQGSTIVDAPDATWQTSKRGRGDVIIIPCPDFGTCTGGVPYTVEAVLSQTRLQLTRPYAGSSGSSVPIQIQRQFSTLGAWENCIDGLANGGSCPFFAPASNSLVADDRAEVGVLYNDGATHAGGFLIDGSVTDSTRTITLTVDPGHRHSGVPHLSTPYTHAFIQNEVVGSPAIDVRDDHVTIEWLDVYNRRGTDGISISNLTAGSNEVVVRQNLIRGGTGQGIVITDVDTVATVSNNIVASVAGHGIALAPLSGWAAGSRIRLLNNTVVPNGLSGTQYGFFATVSSFSVLLRNNLVASAFTQAFSFPDGADAGTEPDVDPASSHNLSADGSGVTHSPAGGGVAAAPTFVAVGDGNYHLAGGSRGINEGANLGAFMTPIDIDNEGRVSPWDIGADEYQGFTAVRLASFTARGHDSAVLVEWETAQELDNLGFHLYRAPSADGPWTRLNSALIPGLGSSPEGRRYEHLDAPLANGTTWFYRLEDLDRRGRITSHGPVFATAGELAPVEEPPAEPPAPPRTKPAASAPWEPHGDPAAVSLREVDRDAFGVTLELVTGGFYSQEQLDGSVRLRVPGFFDHAEPGRPTVPTRRVWTDAAVGRGVSVVSVEPSELQAFPGLRVALAGRPLALASPDGTYRASFVPVSRDAAEKARAADLASASSSAAPSSSASSLFPGALAHVHRTAFQGETKRAYVELAPLRAHEGSGELTLARRLLVRLAFDSRVEGETGRGSLGRRPPASLATAAPAGSAVLARLATTRRGLHAVAFEDLPALPGPLDVASLRLSRLGVPVAFHVEPPTGSFGPGSTLLFLSPGEPDAYAHEAVFDLALAPGGRRMATSLPSRRHLAPAPTLASVRLVRSFERNAEYLPALLDAHDPWVWDLGIPGGQEKDYPFTLDSPVLAPETATLRVHLQGGSDTTVDPDHHVLALLNGSLVGEIRFDGMIPATLLAEAPSSLLREGENTLTLRNTASTGSVASHVYLDRFEVELPAALAVRDGLLEGLAPHHGRLVLDAPQGAVLLDTTDPERPRFLARSTAGRLDAPAEAHRLYLAVFPDAVLAPDLRPGPEDGLRDPDNQADWILVAPEALLPAAEPLRAHRQAQGLAARAVSYEDVVRDFGHGESGPHAVRDFLAFAFHHWRSPAPRYVLLLGDASYDPKGYLPATSRPDLIPAPFTRSTFLFTPADPLYAAVNGDDDVPDIALGRIPAASLPEAEAAVRKILDFENAGHSLLADATLVADNPDLAGDFEHNLDEIATLLARPVTKLYLTQLGAAATRAAVRRTFDAGASLVSYVGHGSAHLWATEGLLRSPDVASFAPQPRQPLVLTMTCSNGYFTSPFSNSLSERLVLAEHMGAIAAFSPSGLSLNDAAHVYHQAFVSEIDHATHHRLGDVLLHAQAAASGAFPELLAFYNLLGDPGLRVR